MRTAWLALGVLVSGCAGGYVPAVEAPSSFQSGRTDPRLAVMQAFGRPLSPIVRNLAVPHGKLLRFPEIQAALMQEVQPLDIALVRSRAALTRALIPSHFTHAMIYLGTEEQLRAKGLWSHPAIRPYQDDIRAGQVILESSLDSVHLSPFRQMVDVDEVLLLSHRPSGRIGDKYAALLGQMGTEFDYTFDYSDTTKLTCAELIVDVFPELRVPVRYSTGRLAIIPDDLARRAFEGSRHLSFRRYFHADGRGGYAEGTRADALSRLSVPKAAPGS
ncbi:MAG: hypothetical protein KF723_06210 [Rhizobiaceae bacterium]|nr:hypothetical protein [Rhizobiaceae bacterium]